MSCSVFGCIANDQSKRNKNDFLFPFPKDANMCKAWKYACGRPEDFRTDTAKMCQLHFDRSDYERIMIQEAGSGTKFYLQLRSYAIPTLNLPKLSGNVSHNVVSGNRSEIVDRTYKRNSDGLNENVVITQDKSSNKKCAVITCNSESKIAFDFPNYQQNKNLYDKWVSLCRNEKLKDIKPKDLNRLYGICEAHFEKEIVILDGSVPTLKLPDSEPEMKDEICEASQLCRLCFDIGTVDLFSSKYYKKILRDIVTIFIPIDIKPDDISKLICENCKCEVIRFYNFLIKSLQVDEYFQAISKEMNNEDEITGDINEVSLIEIEEDSNVKDEENFNIEGGEVSLLRQRLTAGVTELSTSSVNCNEFYQNVNVELPSVMDEKKEVKYSNYVPSYVMKYFHSYVKTPDNKNKKNSINSDNETMNFIQSNRENVEIADTMIICIHCNKAVENLEAFQEHCKMESHDPIFTCPDCNRMFKSEADLNIHSESHRKDISVCDRCGKQFNKRESLYMHLNSVHNRGTFKYQCKICSKKFTTNYRLRLHNRVHTNERPYCCEQCGAVFTLLPNLRNHQATHSDHKPHVCLICNKGFRRKNKLVIHLTKHTGERKYSCAKCGIAYKRQVNLRRHNRKHHPDPNEEIDDTPRTCTHCNFQCNFATQLRLHMLKEHKSYTCTLCNTSFNKYQPYYNHKFKHYPNKKKFQCKYCHKRFINATLLDVHMVVHTGKKNFQCDICKKKFSQRPHLQSHLLIHTGEKPHKCKYCTKSFAHLSTLVVHERIHTGETPYVCQFCNKGFGHLTNYKKHVFSQHGVIMPKQRDYSLLKVGEKESEENSATKLIEMSTVELVDEGNDPDEVVDVNNVLVLDEEIF